MSAVKLAVTKRAAKEFAGLSPQDQTRFRRLMARIQAGEPGVQWKYFTDLYAAARFGTSVMWEAKASHELRMLTTGRQGEVQVLAFTRRSDRRAFGRER